MPGDHLAQGLGKGVQPAAVGKGELHLHHVGVGALGAGMVVEDALLQRRQGVDVLNVGNAARHAVDQSVYCRLVEADQGQHGRGDARGRSIDAIGRHRYPPPRAGLVAALFDQGHQRRLVVAQVLHQAVVA